MGTKYSVVLPIGTTHFVKVTTPRQDFTQQSRVTSDRKNDDFFIRMSPIPGFLSYFMLCLVCVIKVDVYLMIYMLRFQYYHFLKSQYKY